MRTRHIIALTLSAALFGFYLFDRANDLPTGSPTPTVATAGRVTDFRGEGPPEASAPGIAGEQPDVSPSGRQRCTPETRYGVSSDGFLTPLLSCEREDDRRRSGYERYPSDALADLAWSDSEAAQVLAMRLREDDASTSLSLILRASALSGGDPAPVLAFSNAYPKPTSIDGVLVRETVHARFVLAAVAELLGAGPNLLPYWETQIRSVSADPQREIRMLRDRARQLVEEMQRIELEVTGSSTFGGQSDA